ncbi:MAG: hypothetical protein RI959_1511, partial [Pseudomonadota bacterium]
MLPVLQTLWPQRWQPQLLRRQGFQRPMPRVPVSVLVQMQMQMQELVLVLAFQRVGLCAAGRPAQLL